MTDAGLYRETLRPQFHYTAKTGWLNDPNGLMWYEGEYHLFYQAWPQNVKPAGRVWSHAVSPDLVHWTQLDDALLQEGERQIWSGSGVVDHHDTTGFATADEKALIAIYTITHPFEQWIAASTDRGRTFTTCPANPVLEHIRGHNRDPKVLWHEPSARWIMALFLDDNDYALFGSPDLEAWTRLCDVPVPGSGECPDFFELPVDGDPANTRWVFWGANGRYLLGQFDGTSFHPESGPHESNWGANCYAAQTWSDIPADDGRRLQIAWMAGGKYPDMPFDQQMSFPRELSLRTTPEGIRLFIRAVPEIEALHEATHSWADAALRPGENLLDGLEGELLDIRAEIEPADATAIGFTLRGQAVDYRVAEAQVACHECTAPLEAIDGRIQLHILLDRTSIEVFGNDGRISMPVCFLPDPADRTIALRAEGGEARIVSLDVHELRSAWPV